MNATPSGKGAARGAAKSWLTKEPSGASISNRAGSCDRRERERKKAITMQILCADFERRGQKLPLGTRSLPLKPCLLKIAPEQQVRVPAWQVAFTPPQVAAMLAGSYPLTHHLSLY
jgi:hypothetical protein